MVPPSLPAEPVNHPAMVPRLPKIVGVGLAAASAAAARPHGSSPSVASATANLKVRPGPNSLLAQRLGDLVVGFEHCGVLGALESRAQ